MENFLIKCDGRKNLRKIEYCIEEFLTQYLRDQFIFLVKIKNLVNKIIIKKVFLTKKINFIQFPHESVNLNIIQKFS